MTAPAASVATGEAGEHVTTAPAGSPLTAQPAFAAALGPRLVQVTVPVTVLPAGGLAGKPLTAACMSACGVTLIGAVLTLLLGFGSAVRLPAVVLILSVPLAGAVNVLVQLMVLPTANGSGTGFGVHVTVAPAGRPLIVQVAALAGLGPLLTQVPVTVTD